MSGEFAVKFSHEFEDGPSGPARSYWDFETVNHMKLSTICLHPRAVNSELTASSIANMLERAYEMGRASKQDEIRSALGVQP